MKRFGLLAFPVLLMAVSLSRTAPGHGPGAVSPHDGQHLVVIRPADFTEKSALVNDRNATFAGVGISLDKKAAAPVTIRHAGRYTLWVRLGVAKGGPASVNVSVTQGQTTARAMIGDGRGSVAAGGPAGYEAFAKTVRASSPLKERGIEPDAKPDPRASVKNDIDDLEKEIKGATAKPATNWATLARLEEPAPERPFYWWKAVEIDLKPGTAQFRIEPARAIKPGLVLLDAAFLTTNTNLVYPWVGDINAAPGSYIRFRIEEAPSAGVFLSGGMRTHSDPFSTGSVWFNPDKINTKAAEAHTRIGLTRWYRLQDIEKAPAFGSAAATLLLRVAPADKASGAIRGATQFATFPHDDHVVREIRWDEPDGLNISMQMNFERHLDQLRTTRDHAREHYEYALAATGERIYPLTRGGLLFTNGWGAATGDSADYMTKTLRLLGFNCVGQNDDPIGNARRYGWNRAGGHYWPPVHLPFDEAAAKKRYDDHYRAYFQDASKYVDMTGFQIADEPGEIQRTELSAPLYRYRDGRWLDATGGSELHTRRTDLTDCVLEGKIEKLGGWVGFRVGVDDAAAPKKFAYWHLGAVSVNREVNVSAGKEGLGGSSSPVQVTRREATISLKVPTPFKVVYEKGSAALYVNNRVVYQHTDLPRAGGFGLIGPTKAITELRLRPIAKNEHLVAGLPDGERAKKSSPLDDLDLDDVGGTAKKLPDWAKPKPLEQFVREDWVIGGGKPEAHASFREWAKARGLTPETFHKKTWADVRLLTVAEIVEDAADARLYYWSRRYSNYLTPRMFNLAAEAIRAHAPNKDMRGWVALSGHSLYFPSAQPLDMFQLADGPSMTPGVSDWMSLGGWRWDSHQAVAFSVAPYNAGARRYGGEPSNYPMMHCVWPSTFRAYTMLANQVKTVSYWTYGPSYAVTEGYWSDSPDCYHAVHKTNNYSALVDDILPAARMRPSRVAMLYSMATEAWNPQASFADKRATFLALSHEYFQPELVTEEQVLAGALNHYDALYVLDPQVSAAVQEKVAAWVKNGGLTWACADAFSRNEYDEPLDGLATMAGLKRELPARELKHQKPTGEQRTVTPVSGQAEFRPHTIAGTPVRVTATGLVRATYDNGIPAWVEVSVGKGKLVYVGHRCGLTYTSKAARRGGYHEFWSDTGRALLTVPLHEAKVPRELILSETTHVASALSTDAGTVAVLYNLRNTPRTGLKLTLKEPAKPAAVEVIIDGSREPLVSEYADGMLTVSLPPLIDGLIVRVRRTAAPTDPRGGEMRAATEQQLQSNDPKTLAAGAWFVGFHPEWKLADRLVPLLTHVRWEVRRAAAEAIGRLRHTDAVEALRSAHRSESDAHVLADQAFALARLGHKDAATICVALADHSQAIVRQQALRAAVLVKELDAVRLATSAVSDPDLRVRRVAYELLVHANPRAAVERALSAHDDLTDWVRAIARSEMAAAELGRRAKDADEKLLFGVAAQIKAEPLANELIQRVDRLTPETAGAFIAAAVKQRSPAIARKLATAKSGLPPMVVSYLPLIWEATFEVGIGGVEADWERWFASPTGQSGA